MNNWVSQLQQALDEGPAVLVTVARVRGSAPREVGAKMIVSKDTVKGTIGGGQLEFQSLDIAARLLRTRTGQVREVRNFPLGANCGQCCGGVVDILFETVGPGAAWLASLADAHARHVAIVSITPLTDHDAPKMVFTPEELADPFGPHCQRLLASGATGVFQTIKNADKSSQGYLLETVAPPVQRIAVYGAGHVGAALVDLLSKLRYQVDWVDERAELLAAQNIDNVTKICVANPAEHASRVAAGTRCLVMTHSHALDFDICASLLTRADIPFCGLIGSSSKRKRFERLSRQLGLTDDALQKLICPIGITGIDGKAPAEIAVAVAAQLLQLDRSSRTAQLSADEGESGIAALHR